MTTRTEPLTPEERAARKAAIAKAWGKAPHPLAAAAAEPADAAGAETEPAGAPDEPAAGGGRDGESADGTDGGVNLAAGIPARAELERMKRPDLEAIAASAGVEAPADAPNKTALLDAIEAARPSG